MDTLVWLFIYLIFVIISTVLTSNKRKRKTTPTTTYRREPPIIQKPSPLKETKIISSIPEPTTIDTTSSSEFLGVEVLSSTETTKGGLLTALPLEKDSIISGIILREVLGPPKSLQIRRKRF